MNCRHARGLFGAYWDDDITQAEREWLEGHFSRCNRCRHEYEAFSRPLEIMAGLPRAESAPDLVERVLARTRHVVAAPDRLPEVTPSWVPLTAAAALLLIAATLALPWLGARRETSTHRGPGARAGAAGQHRPRADACARFTVRHGSDRDRPPVRSLRGHGIHP